MKAPNAREKWTAIGILVATLLAAFLAVRPAHAQKEGPLPIPLSGKEAGKAPPAPEDPLGRSTPFGTVLGFVKAADRDDLYRAVEYLDTAQSPKKARQLAQELAEILNTAELEDLSRKPEGSADDGLPPGRERVGVVKASSGSYEIFLERVRREPEGQVWLFSADTLSPGWPAGC